MNNAGPEAGVELDTVYGKSCPPGHTRIRVWKGKKAHIVFLPENFALGFYFVH